MQNSHYVDEFEIGMIIIAICDDQIHYKITAHEPYEIFKIYHDKYDLRICFKNDINQIIAKNVNCSHAHFDEYFRFP